LRKFVAVVPELMDRPIGQKVFYDDPVEVIEVLIIGAGDSLGDEADRVNVAAIEQGVAGLIGDRCVVCVEEQREQGLRDYGIVCCGS
jgi:hypothetical protein